MCGIFRVLQLRAGKELQKRKKLKAKWLTRQEKLKWRWESLSETYSEKNTDYLNLKEEYEELEEKLSEFLNGADKSDDDEEEVAPKKDKKKKKKVKGGDI